MFERVNSYWELQGQELQRRFLKNIILVRLTVWGSKKFKAAGLSRTKDNRTMILRLDKQRGSLSSWPRLFKGDSDGIRCLQAPYRLAGDWTCSKIMKSPSSTEWLQCCLWLKLLHYADRGISCLERPFTFQGRETFFIASDKYEDASIVLMMKPLADSKYLRAETQRDVTLEVEVPYLFDTEDIKVSFSEDALKLEVEDYLSCSRQCWKPRWLIIDDYFHVTWGHHPFLSYFKEFSFSIACTESTFISKDIGRFSLTWCKYVQVRCQKYIDIDLEFCREEKERARFVSVNVAGSMWCLDENVLDGRICSKTLLVIISKPEANEDEVTWKKGELSSIQKSLPYWSSRQRICVPQLSLDGSL